MNPLDEARAALEVAREEPRTALARAANALDKCDSPECVATAHFAIGLAH